MRAPVALKEELHLEFRHVRRDIEKDQWTHFSPVAGSSQ
jgi:hypothetical protein